MLAPDAVSDAVPVPQITPLDTFTTGVGFTVIVICCGYSLPILSITFRLYVVVVKGFTFAVEFALIIFAPSSHV